MNAIKRTLLRVRGINPDEIERIVGESRQDRERVRREQKQAEDEAHRRYVNLRMRRS